MSSRSHKRLDDSSSSPYADGARLQKALSLSDCIGHYLDHGVLVASLLDDGAVLRAMPEEWWKGLAHAAGVNPPSEATINEVVKILTRRANPLGPDVFKRFEND